MQILLILIYNWSTIIRRCNTSTFTFADTSSKPRLHSCAQTTLKSTKLHFKRENVLFTHNFGRCSIVGACKKFDTFSIFKHSCSNGLCSPFFCHLRRLDDVRGDISIVTSVISIVHGPTIRHSLFDRNIESFKSFFRLETWIIQGIPLFSLKRWRISCKIYTRKNGKSYSSTHKYLRTLTLLHTPKIEKRWKIFCTRHHQYFHAKCTFKFEFCLIFFRRHFLELSISNGCSSHFQ